MSASEPPTEWVETVSASAAEWVSAKYRALGFLVDVLQQPPASVALYIHRPKQSVRWPRIGERGFDISHYQRLQTAAGFAQAMASGITWAGFKLGEGQGMDEQAIQNAKLAREVGLPFLGYFEFRYDLSTELQRVWLETALTAIGERPPLGVFAALEENYILVNGVPTLVDPAPYAARMADDVQAILEFLPRVVGRFGVYSRRTWVARWLAGATFLRNYDLWNAFYPLAQPAGPTLPAYRCHAFWQNADGTPNARVVAWQYYAPGVGLNYELALPGVGLVDQSYWLQGAAG